MRLLHGKINTKKQYEVDNAIYLLKESATAKFIESVDVAINMGIDPRKPEQNVRGSTLLPYGTGRFVRVAVFAKGQDIEAAQKAGADLVGTDNLSELIKQGKINFDIIVATPDTMEIVNQLGPILGPKGLMPNQKIGTITSNITETVANIKMGQIYYRNDQNGIIHAIIGKINFNNDKLKSNLEALLRVLQKNKPAQIKSTYIKKISISTTMGVGIIIKQSSLNINMN